MNTDTIMNIFAFMVLSLMCIALIVVGHLRTEERPTPAVFYVVIFVLLVNLMAGSSVLVYNSVSYAKTQYKRFIVVSLEKENIKESTAEWQESMSATINFTQMMADGLKSSIDKERAIMRTNGASEKVISEALKQDIAQWRHQVLLHNNAVRRFNIAKMRFAQGSQYRGAEKALLQEIDVFQLNRYDSAVWISI